MVWGKISVFGITGTSIKLPGNLIAAEKRKHLLKLIVSFAKKHNLLYILTEEEILKSCLSCLFYLYQIQKMC